jgi:putative sigma-54 modulation protein
LNLIFTTHDVQLAPAVRTYADEKVRRLDRHYDRIVDARLEFELESGRGSDPPKAVKLHVHVSRAVLTARATAREWRVALDEVVDKMDEQLRRRKQRMAEHRPAPMVREVENP